MQQAHPLVREIETKHQMGRAEAEQFLRGMAGTSKDAAQAVKEIDEAREIDRLQRESDNEEMAKALGMTMDQAQALANTLAKYRHLFTWLCRRVHETMAGDRPLAHDE